MTMSGAVPGGVLPRLLLLVAAVRAGGVRIGPGRLLSAHRALRGIDAGDRRASYWALRRAMCSHPGDLAPFDAAFAEVFVTP
jgi:uncharacterized protein with von Willebrand factor type A (vWA) domain